MSDPDDPSSRRFNQEHRHPTEWDKKEAHVGSSVASASRSASNNNEKGEVSSSSGANSSSDPTAQDTIATEHRGKRNARFSRKISRLVHFKKHDDDDVPVNSNMPSDEKNSSGPTSNATGRGAQDIQAPPDGTSAVDPRAGDDAIKRHNILVRFFIIAKNILLSNYFNILLVFVPVGIAVHFVGARDEIIFAMNAIAIIPLAGLLAFATEVVALSLGDTLGALLNVSFGNAVELIIFIIALVKNEIRIVQASLIGSILANLLLILGMAFLFGGLRFQEQLYNSTVTQMSACLLSLSVISLLLPTAFHASFSETAVADGAVLKVSRGTSVILLLVYILYLLFQLKSHAYMYESTPQHIIDEESHPGVLAELLNSSSSGDDSSSDSDSSSSSGGSHRTAKAIRRAFRRRRNTSSSDKKSVSSYNGTGEHRPVGFLRKGSGSGSSASNAAVASGDEADTDGEHDNPRSARSLNLGQVQHRDFGGERSSLDYFRKNSTEQPAANGRVSPAASIEKAEAKPRRRPSKKERRDLEKKEKREKKERKRRSNVEKQDQEGNTAEGIELATIEEIKAGPSQSENEMIRHKSHPGESTRPQVAFSSEAEVARAQTPGGGLRRPLVALPSVPIRRPQVQKMLSQTVFSREYNAQALARPSVAAVPRAPYGLRRTSSLPEMMVNKSASFYGKKVPPTLPVTETNPAVGVNADTTEGEAKEKTDLKHTMSRTAAVIMLLIVTALVAVCAEFLVDSINGLVEQSSVTEAFIGLIILPIVGNAAEHVTAVTVATKNKMDLAIGVAVGSSIQIAIFVTPVVVLLGWILNKDMSLYFTLFETVSLFASAFIVNFLVLDGRSNYLEGSLLCAAYTIIAVAAFFYPNCDASSGAVCNGASITGGGT